MADVKITELPELTEVAADDYLEIVDTSVNTNKKISRETLAGWHFLTTPLTSSTWSISSPKSSTSPTLIDMSATFPNYPATPPKALMVRLIARDSVAVYRTDLHAAFGPSVIRYYQLSVHPFGGDIQVATGGIINCNADGDIAVSLVASGTDTMDAQLEIWGYWL